MSFLVHQHVYILGGPGFAAIAVDAMCSHQHAVDRLPDAATAITFSGVTSSTMGFPLLVDTTVVSLLLLRSASRCLCTRLPMLVRRLMLDVIKRLVAAAASLFQRLRPADDLGDLLGDLRLPGAVVLAASGL